MNDLRTRTTIAAIALTLSAALTAPVLANNDQPQAEILHWWSSPGEAAALNVFIEAFKARGGHYYDSTKDDQVASRDEAIERMGKGYPSTLTQWNAGRDIYDFYEYGLTAAITDPILIDKLKRSLPKPVLDAVTFDGDIIALPANIHSENWMWYSNEVINYADALVSGDWQKFLDMGNMLSKKDTPLLAIGDQEWQVRILFTSLFLGISRNVYNDFYLGNITSTSIVDSHEFQRTLKVFNQLAKYSESFGDGNWNTQVKAVADNQAGATFMGDWAKGEFQALGKTPGEEYGCALTAGNDPSILLVIDAFILGKVNDPAEIAGQVLMLDVISDPAVNQQFNKLKGSVSPFVNPDDIEPDVCSAQVYKTLANEEAVIAPYASYKHGQYMHSLDNEIYRFWKASQANEKDADQISTSTENFRKILRELIDNPPRTLATNEE